MAVPDLSMAYTGDVAERIALAIVRSRVLDEYSAGLARRGLVALAPPAGGMEGHLFGGLAALRATDWLFGDVRTSAVALERGLPVRSWLAMLLGVADAAHRGHASPGEMTAADSRMVSTSCLLGTHLPQAGGVAHGMKVRATDEVVLAWFGPGAAASGDAHVAFNFAGVFGTPVIFYFCSSGEGDAERLGGDSFAERAEGYGIAAAAVDAADPMAVRDVVAAAAARARAGGGATLIEGSCSGDPLAALGVAPAQTEAVAEALRAELRAATEELLAAGPPALATLFEDVFAEPTPALAEQRAGLAAHRARFATGEID